MNKESIEEITHRIIERSPGPVVEYRLLRDVLLHPPEDAQLRKASQKLADCVHVRELIEEQREDGSWGPFHSRNTKQKQKIHSTEVGVERAKTLGLEGSHLVLKRAAAYIVDIMKGKKEFPDQHEKNDRWSVGMRLFLASTLSLIKPEHPILNEDREMWHVIVQRTFQSGKYNEDDEITAHREITGATVNGSYLVLANRYQLNVLGSKLGLLSKGLEAALLQWIWECEDGIGYLQIPLSGQSCSTSGQFDRWLASLELLSRYFPCWVQFAQEAIQGLWKGQNEQGFWDFGSRPSSLANLPLSDSWRRRDDRVFDWSTRVLTILRRYNDEVKIY